MRTALLSAVAALALTSTYSVSSFAQHDDDTSANLADNSKGIFGNDISRFESYMPSQPV